MAYLNVTVLPAAASTAEAGAGASTKAVELALALTTIEKPPTMIGESQQWTFAPAPQLAPHGTNRNGAGNGSAWRLDKVGGPGRFYDTEMRAGFRILIFSVALKFSQGCLRIATKGIEHAFAALFACADGQLDRPRRRARWCKENEKENKRPFSSSHRIPTIQLWEGKEIPQLIYRNRAQTANGKLNASGISLYYNDGDVHAGEPVQSWCLERRHCAHGCG